MTHDSIVQYIRENLSIKIECRASDSYYEPRVLVKLMLGETVISEDEADIRIRPEDVRE